MMRNRTTVILLILLSLLLLISISRVSFASSENWVELTRVTGKGLLMGSTEAFAITHVDWRIQYNYTYQLEFGNIPVSFSVVPHENYVVDGNTTYFTESLITFNPEEKNGTCYLDGYTGVFHLHFSPTNVANFSFIVEQNIKSRTDFPLESYSLFEEKTFHVHDTHDFYAIRIYSNSTVSDFYFHYALMRISFYVNGTIGTTGVCNVTIPSEFMSTEFSIFKDEKPLVKNTDYTETFNSTHYLFTIKYEHSTHLIEIFANNKIPEFPSWTLLVTGLLGVTVLSIIYGRDFKQGRKK